MVPKNVLSRFPVVRIFSVALIICSMISTSTRAFNPPEGVSTERSEFPYIYYYTNVVNERSIPYCSLHIFYAVCTGTTVGMSVPSNRSRHFEALKDRYTNCTVVNGNLELTWIEDQEADLSFLQHVREVTGYVFISHVDARQVILPNLELIRGRSLFRLKNEGEEFALMLSLTKIYTLQLPALRGKPQLSFPMRQQNVPMYIKLRVYALLCLLIVLSYFNRNTGRKCGCF